MGLPPSFARGLGRNTLRVVDVAQHTTDAKKQPAWQVDHAIGTDGSVNRKLGSHR